ncbi:hypothetical protein OF846_005036 [Rhodotorula toruloides]|nr:hypothetical protein OF846_005036 [Rhodotorula toruloides]
MHTDCLNLTSDMFKRLEGILPSSLGPQLLSAHNNHLKFTFHNSQQWSAPHVAPFVRLSDKKLPHFKAFGFRNLSSRSTSSPPCLA